MYNLASNSGEITFQKTITMKATLLLSSIFFLLGLKISSFIDIRGKANVVDKIITNKIINSKPVKALPLFNDTNEETVSQDQQKVELKNPENETLEKEK